MMLIYNHMHIAGLAKLRWPEVDITHMLVSAVVTSSRVVEHLTDFFCVTFPASWFGIFQ